MAKRGRPCNFDRAEVLQQAMQVFWEQGYEGASMAALGAATGLNPPSIYAAFGAKEALFGEAVALYRATEGARIWGVAMAAPSVREGVASLLQASAREFTRPDKPRGCLVVLGALFVDHKHEPVYRALQAYRAEGRALLLERFRRGVEAGELPPGQDWQAVVDYIITLQQGMSIQARDGASCEMLLGLAAQAMRAWDAMCAAPVVHGDDVVMD